MFAICLKRLLLSVTFTFARRHALSQLAQTNRALAARAMALSLRLRRAIQQSLGLLVRPPCGLTRLCSSSSHTPGSTTCLAAVLGSGKRAPHLRLRRWSPATQRRRCSSSYSPASSPSYQFSFGVVADIQYADVPDGPNFRGSEQRRYRESLGALQQVRPSPTASSFLSTIAFVVVVVVVVVLVAFCCLWSPPSSAASPHAT